jgi:hypothetical protein
MNRVKIIIIVIFTAMFYYNYLLHRISPLTERSRTLPSALQVDTFAVCQSARPNRDYGHLR